MKILMCYFSATGNTAKMAKVIGKRLFELGAELDFLDAILPAVRKLKVDMAQYQAAVFGSPIHSMRAPRIFREWLGGLDGQGRKCATFFTYGGFQVHPVHHTTAQILKQGNFNLIASAEFPGAHTYNLGGWKAMIGRPDESDQAMAEQYAENIWARFTGQDPGAVTELDTGPYSESQLDDFEKFRFLMVNKLPTRDGEDCSMCMICEDQCPSGAMNAETGQADKDKCIVCLRCLKECPDQAIKINDLTYFFAKKMENDKETEASLKTKRSKIYL